MASGTTRCSLVEVGNFILIKVLSADLLLRRKTPPGLPADLLDDFLRRLYLRHGDLIPRRRRRRFHDQLVWAICVGWWETAARFWAAPNRAVTRQKMPSGASFIRNSTRCVGPCASSGRGCRRGGRPAGYRGRGAPTPQTVMRGSQQMAPDAEEILHDTVNRREPLELSGRLETPHLALTLAGRLVGDLRAVVLVLIGAVKHRWHHRATGGRVAEQLIGNQALPGESRGRAARSVRIVPRLRYSPGFSRSPMTTAVSSRRNTAEKRRYGGPDQTQASEDWRRGGGNGRYAAVAVRAAERQ